MRNIILAVAIAVGPGALLFLASTAAGIPADAAKGVAGLPALAIKNIYDFLETQSAKRTLAHANSIVSFEEFAMHPLSAFILAVIMFLGLIMVTNIVTGFLISMIMSAHRDLAQSQPTLIMNLIAMTAIPLNVIGISYIGRWIGYRSRPLHGLAVAIVSIVFGVLANSLLNAVITPILRNLFPENGLLTDEVDLQANIFQLYQTLLDQYKFVISLVVLYITAVSLGVWRGERRRLARYLEFVLKILPPETRQTIVEIARDEARRASTAVGLGAREAVRA